MLRPNFTMRLVRPTRLTLIAAVTSMSLIAFSASFLLVRYASLPSLLAVHFRPNGFPNGWQYRTYPLVLMPVFVQVALALTLGAIGSLLLSRPHGTHDEGAPDVKAAAAAAEAVALLTLIWVGFQAYAALALAAMWQRERAGLGWYGYLAGAGIVLTILVSVRAHLRLGHPAPRPFVSEHWRFGQLYKNAADPALFVPTRNGRRWTLNFGRPVASALLGIILLVGVLAPAAIFALLLR
jgi:uncharacterized membrane protein